MRWNQAHNDVDLCLLSASCASMWSQSSHTRCSPTRTTILVRLLALLRSCLRLIPVCCFLVDYKRISHLLIVALDDPKPKVKKSALDALAVLNDTLGPRCLPMLEEQNASPAHVRALLWNVAEI